MLYLPHSRRQPMEPLPLFKKPGTPHRLHIIQTTQNKLQPTGLPIFPLDKTLRTDIATELVWLILLHSIDHRQTIFVVGSRILLLLRPHELRTVNPFPVTANIKALASI